jgi:tRNA(Ile)-lysidine synthase
MGAREATEAQPFARRFRQAHRQALPEPVPRRWLVAYSGGLDSTLLLHALKQAESGIPIAAVHIDHGLQTDSAAWAGHCAAAAAALGVDFICQRVAVDLADRAGVEAAARQARYAALAAIIGPDEVLLTAHHADDQLETLLLRLLRGTGVRGLAAIHPLLPFGAGRLLRPLLRFSRAEIRREADRLGLDWLEDPSNDDSRFDRNYLRHRCLPPLLERWPRARALAGRLAERMAETETLLAELAAADLGAGDDVECLPLTTLAALSGPRLGNALRHAVRRAGLPVPTAAQLEQLKQALTAREDAETAVRWPGAEARRYRGRLYLLVPPAGEPARGGRVSVGQAHGLAAGELGLEATADYGITDRWARHGLEVGFRVGGERFLPHRSQQHKSLKHWFQEAGIVPWMRSQVPLLYHGDRIVAVADLGLADGLPDSSADAPFWRPVWTGHPRLR